MMYNIDFINKLSEDLKDISYNMKQLSDNNCYDAYDKDTVSTILRLSHNFNVVDDMIISFGNLISDKITEKEFVTKIGELNIKFKYYEMDIGKCVVCGNTFSKHKVTQKYCCKKCRRVAQNKRMYNKKKHLDK